MVLYKFRIIIIIISQERRWEVMYVFSSATLCVFRQPVIMFPFGQPEACVHLLTGPVWARSPKI